MKRDVNNGGDTAPNARDLLDAYFDGDIDRAGKGRLHEALHHDPVLAEEFSRTSEAVSMLRQSGSNAGLGVDLTERVLARCDSQRGYLNKRGRRFVLAGRSAVALAALALTAGVVLFIRLTPPELRLPESQRPLNALLDGGNTDAATLRLVPPNVHRELSDSVDQSKAERTIVFHLEPDPAASFSALGRLEPTPQDTRAMARLPMFVRESDAQASRAAAMGVGPLSTSRQAASVVRPPDALAQGWWSRGDIDDVMMAEPDRGLGLWLILRRDDPRLPDEARADRDRE